jgi:uncharacterized Zn finger protein (UPF0148 family)
MSIQSYCHHCGTKLIAGSKFCNSCGTSLASLSEQPKSPQQQYQPRYNNHEQSTVALVENGEEDGDEYIDRMAHYQTRLDALQVEIEKPRGVQKDTIESLAKNTFFNGSTEQRIAPPAISTEEALKQFKQEASAIRPD